MYNIESGSSYESIPCFNSGTIKLITHIILQVACLITGRYCNRYLKGYLLIYSLDVQY